MNAILGYSDRLLKHIDNDELNREIAQEVLEDEECIVAGIAENGVIDLAAGMNEHLIKPIDIKKLKETLAKFVS